MKTWKKTFVGGLAAFFLAFSCCWISALAIWLGGTTLLGVLAVYLESMQLPLIILGAALITAALISYNKKIQTNKKHEHNTKLPQQ